VVAIQALAGSADQKTQILITSALLIICLGCSLSCFATSLYRWGEQWDNAAGPTLDKARL
jgi:hypothetical protein